MKRMLGVFLLFLTIYSPVTLANKCESQKWTREDGRTQAGGWIWFPGKGTGENLQISYMKSEGMAIDRLIKECGFPHKEVKFHERCDEKVGKFYQTYVRASLTHKQCHESKYAANAFKPKILNRKLLAIHKKYLAAITKDTAFEEKACTRNKPLKCHEMGKYEFQMGNQKKALLYFNKACQGGSLDSCFNAGITKRMQAKPKEALAFFKLTCQGKNGEDGEGCYFVGLLYSEEGNTTKAKTFFELACKSNVSIACFSLGRVYQKENNEYLAEKFFKKSCSADYKEGCFEASKFFYDKGDKPKAKSYSNLGCQMDHDKSCYNLGSLENKNKIIRFDAFNKACGLGLGVGCLKAAKHKKKNDSLFKRACELGEGKGCRELSARYYDRGKMSKSLEFSKLACKLGQMKSCHNAGLILIKKGEPKEAKDYLEQSCDDGIKQSCKLIKKHSL
jgi:TPR repeat protein